MTTYFVAASSFIKEPCTSHILLLIIHVRCQVVERGICVDRLHSNTCLVWRLDVRPASYIHSGFCQGWRILIKPSCTMMVIYIQGWYASSSRDLSADNLDLVESVLLKNSLVNWDSFFSVETIFLTFLLPLEREKQAGRHLLARGEQQASVRHRATGWSPWRRQTPVGP